MKMVTQGNRREAWIVVGMMCSNCAGKVKACDSLDDQSDYEWFCANEGCENHAGERTFDTDQPAWIEDE